MGCTSSAPNMPNVMANSVSENNLEDSEGNEMKQIDERDETMSLDNSKENSTNATKVLPTCDNLDETFQLARNNQSFIESASADLGRANEYGNEEKFDDDKTKTVHTTQKNDLDEKEKLERMEEVVEKVVEHFIADHQETVAKQSDEPSLIIDIMENTAEQNTANEKDESDKMQELQEMVSPSQSESSRATRWEALADIAAELPPSLAVDPVTGQIYTLSK